MLKLKLKNLVDKNMTQDQLIIQVIESLGYSLGNLNVFDAESFVKDSIKVLKSLDGSNGNEAFGVDEGTEAHSKHIKWLEEQTDIVFKKQVVDEAWFRKEIARYSLPNLKFSAWLDDQVYAKGFWVRLSKIVPTNTECVNYVTCRAFITAETIEEAKEKSKKAIHNCLYSLYPKDSCSKLTASLLYRSDDEQEYALTNKQLGLY